MVLRKKFLILLSFLTTLYGCSIFHSNPIEVIRNALEISNSKDSFIVSDKTICNGSVEIGKGYKYLDETNEYLYSTLNIDDTDYEVLIQQKTPEYETSINAYANTSFTNMEIYGYYQQDIISEDFNKYHELFSTSMLSLLMSGNVQDYAEFNMISNLDDLKEIEINITDIEKFNTSYFSALDDIYSQLEDATNTVLHYLSFNMNVMIDSSGLITNIETNMEYTYHLNRYTKTIESSYQYPDYKVINTKPFLNLIEKANNNQLELNSNIIIPNLVNE